MEGDAYRGTSLFILINLQDNQKTKFNSGLTLLKFFVHV